MPTYNKKFKLLNKYGLNKVGPGYDVTQLYSASEITEDNYVAKRNNFTIYGNFIITNPHINKKSKKDKNYITNFINWITRKKK